jgi:hypothetical protein
MILSKNVIIENIKREINDNTTGQITPFDISHNLIDIVDSIHVLTAGKNIDSNNVTTFPSGNTKLGDNTLRKQGISGYHFAYNTAVGNHALSNIAQGVRNTSIGSESLVCNINGDDNVAVGVHALAGNALGVGNIAVGNYGLNFTRTGNYNIAIGHGAGYYVDEESDYQFFVASHNVDADYICANPSGVGLVPLMMGDLTSTNLRLGIGVSGVHSGATLQVGGNIHPNQSGVHDIGGGSYRFRSLYLDDDIYFQGSHIKYNPNDTFSIGSDITVTGSGNFSDSVITSGQIMATGQATFHDGLNSYGQNKLYGAVEISGHTTFAKHRIYNIGNAGSEALNVFTHNLKTTGKTVLQDLHTENQTHYAGKILHLASSGDGYIVDGGSAGGMFDDFLETHVSDEENFALLNDEELVDAGLQIKATGIGYTRTYKFGFKPQDSTISYITNDTINNRSSWFSNISLNIVSGAHLEAGRILHRGDFSLTNNDSGRGLYVRGDKTYFTYEDNLTPGYSGVSNYNFISKSNATTFSSMLGLHGSGNVSQKFLANTSGISPDGSFYNYDGFDLCYITDSSLQSPSFFNEAFGQSAKRFAIRALSNTSYAKRSIVMMQDNNDGVVGINNFNYGDSLVPDTILNIRATGNADLRVTAENSSDSHAKLDLLYGSNALQNGVDFDYHDNTGNPNFTINKYTDSAKTEILRVEGSSKVGIMSNSGIQSGDSVLNIGNTTSGNYFVSIAESSGIPSAYNGFGTLFVKKGSDTTKSSILNFVDSSGNIFNFLVDATDSSGESIEKSLIVDQFQNTFGGRSSPASRTQLTAQNPDNTAVGHSALSAITSGNYNHVYGSQSLKTATTAFNNIVIGANNIRNAPTASGNIIIGSNKYTSDTSDIVDKLVIGNVFEGDLSTKNVNMPDATLQFQNSSNTKSLKISDDTIEKIDSVGALAYPHDSLNFKFSGTSTGTLMTLNHTASPLVKSATYVSNSVPYVEIKGDIKLLGGISFSDNTELTSASVVTDVSALTTRVNTAESNISALQTTTTNTTTRIDDLIVEGTAVADIPTPASASLATTGTLQLKVVNSSSQLVDKTGENLGDLTTVTIHNRDPRMPIDAGDYIVAIKVNNEYRPIWISGPRL